jgi:DNA-binding IclR family transcriptional regulator
LQILEILKSHNSLSVSDIQKLSGANYNTLKVKLKDLVQMKKIVSVGKGRGFVYQIKINQN